MTDGGNQRASQAAPRAVVVVGAGHQLAAAQFAGVREVVGAAQVVGVAQQRGDDEGGRRAPGGRQCPGLQQVPCDRDGLPEVLPALSDANSSASWPAGDMIADMPAPRLCSIRLRPGGTGHR